MPRQTTPMPARGDHGVQVVATGPVGVLAHLFNTASITAFAIGPPSWPPAISFPGASWIMTATATSAFSGRRERHEPAVGRLALDAALRRAGLAGDAHAVDRGGGGGAVVDRRDEQVGELGGGLRGDRVAEPLRLRRLQHVEARGLHLVDEVGAHQPAAVGDRGDDHRHLQRRRLHRELPEAGAGGLGVVELARLLLLAVDRVHDLLREDRAGLRAEVEEVVAVEAERLGGLAQLLRPDGHRHLREGGVAGVLHRGREGDLRRAAARAALVVDDVLRAARARRLPGRARTGPGRPGRRGRPRSPPRRSRP